MGAIYKVHHTLLDEIRVIKVMRAHTAGQEDMQHRFLQEAKMVTRLKHPNIASVFDYALDHDATAYIVMEFIDGVSLADLMRAFKSLDIPLALEITRQALDALAYIHRKNITHRDISPDNIMCTDVEGRLTIKLIDLGIAKDLDATESVTRTGMFLGKLKYASPEQLGMIEEGGSIDGRSDLYSLGIVLYQILTGEMPISGTAAHALVAGHLYHPPLSFDASDPDRKVPDELRAVVLKALQKKRGERWINSEEFYAEIVRLQRIFPYVPSAENLAMILASGRDASVKETPEVTPSVQDRVANRFAKEQTTPVPRADDYVPFASPRSSSETNQALLQTVPAVRLRHAATVIEERGTAQAAIPERAPLAPHRKKWLAPLVAVLLIATVGAFYFASRNRTDSRESGTETTRPRIEIPPATSTLAPPPANTATTTNIVLAAPGVPSTTVTAGTVPVRPPTIPKTSSGPPVSAALLRATSRAATARGRAETAGAATFAAELFNAAVTRQNAGDRFRAAGDERHAVASYEDAAATFDRAVTAAKNDRARLELEAAARRSPVPVPVATATQPPVVVSPLPPVTTPPPAKSSSDEERIRQVITRFIEAQESLNADLYIQVFPTASRARVATSFAQLRGQKLVLEITSIQVTGDRATVRASESRTIFPKVGTDQHFNRATTIALDKTGDTWVISRLK